jgi:hypothetical protein
MKYRASSVNSIPAHTTRQIQSLKKSQDDTTAQLASDTTSVIGVGDVDLIHFLTEAFTGTRMVQKANGAGAVGSLAILPDEQHAASGSPYWQDGKVMALDRAGTGNFGFNIIRTGQKADGHAKGNTRIIQKRFAAVFNPDIDRVSYHVQARLAPLGYGPQADERLDGDFFPGSIYLGVSQPYGLVDMTAYNNDPYGPDGWNGAVNSVPTNSATKPVISSISPNSYQLGVGGSPEFHLTGSNFTSAGFAGIGPFMGFHDIPLSSNPDYVLPDPLGAYYNRYIPDDTNLYFYLNVGEFVAGSYTVWVIGIDGQVGTIENGFTVLEAAP